MKKEFEKLLDLIKLSLDKCPWVKEQNIESYAKELLSEAKEVNEAIKNKDDSNLAEELGDLFWDITVAIHILERDKKIKTSDVLKRINEKITRRKPHIFDNSKQYTLEEVSETWQKVKKLEKENKP
jgi:uncharacterized protein YabN with tetrapyrrole methylase and pyrophosphatase domain